MNSSMPRVMPPKARRNWLGCMGPAHFRTKSAPQDIPKTILIPTPVAANPRPNRVVALENPRHIQGIPAASIPMGIQGIRPWRLK